MKRQWDMHVVLTWVMMGIVVVVWLWMLSVIVRWLVL